MPELFTGAFLAALFLTTLLRLWLARRQISHVRARRGTVPARFASRIGLESHEKAAAYTIARVEAGMFAIVIDAAIALLLTLGGALQWWSGALAPHFSGITHGVLLLGGMLLLTTLLELPLTLYQQFGIEARFGFNRMTPALFVSDLVKQIALAGAIGLPLLYAVLALMSRMGSEWWIWVWLLWGAFSLLMVWIYPTLIAPIFNKFTPLADGALRSRIEDLLARCGFQASGLYLMDGSRRSAHGNAYFTGFGRSKRIVFFDTLIERLTPDEIEAVLAHELGHFHHRHVIQRIALALGSALVFLWVLAQAMNAPWFYAGLGVESASTAMALALFVVVVPAFTFPLTPFGNFLSRRHEFEADRYAARNASAPAMISALLKLYVENAATLTPDPLYSRFYDSHPPAPERIGALDTLTPTAPGSA